MNKIKILLGIILILSLIGILAGVQRFYSGIHNIDLGTNMMRMECYNGSPYLLTDTGSDGIIRTSEEVYVLGLNQLNFSLQILISFSVVFGIVLSFLVFRNSNKNVRRSE